MWIDTHAHLFDLSEDSLTSQLNEASASGVEIVVSTATNLLNAGAVISHAAFPTVFGAIGISPFDVQNLPPDWEEMLWSYLQHGKVIACGEIGIDATNPTYPPMGEQEEIFMRQLEIAQQCALPVIIHSRGAEERAVELCKKTGVSSAVFHCFTGSEHALAAVIDSGYYISLSGIVTFRNGAVRECINKIPLDRLLIETDCPYLAPVPHRGKVNQPAWVRFTGIEVAKLLAIEAKALSGQIIENFRRVFPKAGYAPVQHSANEN